MVVMVAITAVGAAFRLEWGLHLFKLGSEAMEHLLDHMIRTNAKNVVANFSRQMSVSQVPGETYELIGVVVSDLDNCLRGSTDFEQPSIFKLESIPIGHGNRFRKIEKDILALIRNQASAPAVARVEVERESARRPFLGPMPSGPMH
jgi:hypothetical protein